MAAELTWCAAIQVQLGAEPVGGSVGERGPRPDDGDPQDGVAEVCAAGGAAANPAGPGTADSQGWPDRDPARCARAARRRRRAGRAARHPDRHAPQPASVKRQLPHRRTAPAAAAEATVTLIRTAQEALVNAAKHAPLQPIDVGLHYREDAVQLNISNPLPPGSHANSPGSEAGIQYRQRRIRPNGHVRAAAADQRLPHRGIRRRPLDRHGAGTPMSQPPAEAPLRVIIADDQASVREGLVLLRACCPTSRSPQPPLTALSAKLS